MIGDDWQGQVVTDQILIDRYRHRQGQANIQDVARRATTGSRTEVQINRSEITCRDLILTKHHGSHRDSTPSLRAELRRGEACAGIFGGSSV